MATKSGFVLKIAAFIEVDAKSLDDQFAKLAAVRDAKASGDYSGLLQMATIDSVTVDQKARRVPDAVAMTPAEPGHEDVKDAPEPDGPTDDFDVEKDVPESIRGKRRDAA